MVNARRSEATIRVSVLASRVQGCSLDPRFPWSCYGAAAGSVGTVRKPERWLRRLLQTAVGMILKKSAEGPPYSFPRLWQFPQATCCGSILQPGAGAYVPVPAITSREGDRGATIRFRSELE